MDPAVSCDNIVCILYVYFMYPAVSCDSSLSLASQTSGMIGQLQGSLAGGDREVRVDYNGLDFRIMIDSRSGPPVTITLVASTLQEKSAWCSDISQVGINCNSQVILYACSSIRTCKVTSTQMLQGQGSRSRFKVKGIILSCIFKHL